MKFGPHSLQELDSRFAKEAYFWWGPKDIVLSLIVVQKSFRRRGVVNQLCETVKRYNRPVLVPEPSIPVRLAAIKAGYHSAHVKDTHGYEMLAMVWVPQTHQKQQQKQRTNRTTPTRRSS